MKTSHLICIGLIGMFTTFTATAQNNVGIGTSAPDASAALEIESTTQGLLPPRMTEAQRNAIAAPVAAGLIVWCTNCGTDGELQVYNGTNWTNMVGDTASNPIGTVQERLDRGETPKQIFDSGMPLDSIYGNTYQGGLIAYLNTTTGTGLIAAAIDQSAGMQWTLPAYQSILIGGSAQSTTDGALNTTAIINQTGQSVGPPNTVTSDYAAGLCRNYTGGGYTDWYLPSKDELNYLWENLADSDGDNDNTGPSDPNNLGGFALYDYWSSTEVDNGTAWGQFFVNGYQNFFLVKNATNYVRAVRAF